MKDLRNAIGAMCAVPMPGITALHAVAGELRAAGRHVRSLTFENPRFETPCAIRRRCVEFLEQSGVGGTPAAGLPELRSRVADKLSGQKRNPLFCVECGDHPGRTVCPVCGGCRVVRSR